LFRELSRQWNDKRTTAEVPRHAQQLQVALTLQPSMVAKGQAKDAYGGNAPRAARMKKMVRMFSRNKFKDIVTK
ncbi:hypothetical protein ANCCAN_18838, partial [Ancylostoma caninum]